MITKKDARAYLNRWRLVDEALAAALRQTPMKEKLHQMDACYRMAVGLGLIRKLTAAKRKNEKEVSRRWRRLKGLAP